MGLSTAIQHAMPPELNGKREQKCILSDYSSIYEIKRKAHKKINYVD